jgi:hypothetical protein
MLLMDNPTKPQGAHLASKIMRGTTAWGSATTFKGNMGSSLRCPAAHCTNLTCGRQSEHHKLSAQADATPCHPPTLQQQQQRTEQTHLLLVLTACMPLQARH